jgi:hypothetical protein
MKNLNIKEVLKEKYSIEKGTEEILNDDYEVAGFRTVYRVYEAYQVLSDYNNIISDWHTGYEKLGTYRTLEGAKKKVIKVISCEHSKIEFEKNELKEFLNSLVS